ncbi:hypothetical protein CGRA01v4_08036 [Colletotrichum graminicola]|nr:hypothetical protein CGRA01v4_08036 [Colletotrichum graminicola]
MGLHGFLITHDSPFPPFLSGASRDSDFGVCTCSQPIHAFLHASQIWKSGDGLKAGGS